MKFLDDLRRKVVRILVEKTPFLKDLFALIDGNKTLIGKVCVLISLLLAALQYAFPQIPHINEINAYTAMVVAWLFEQIGETHRQDKELREELFRGEFGPKDLIKERDLKS